MASNSEGCGPAARWRSKEHNQRSIVQVDVQYPSELPFNPPAAEYVEEALMGLRGSPHDMKTRQIEPKLAQQVDHLFDVARHESEPLQNVCTELFWIAMGVIFTRTSLDVVETFRRRLSHSWHLLCIVSGEGLRGDPARRDWALTAFLMTTVQAIYRLLIDGFSQDKAQFTENAAQILDKLMQLVYFETSGFPVHPETARKGRRKLFSKYVLNNPHINLEELEKFQKRQELLESMQMTTNHEPLTFGHMNGSNLESKQLRCLLESREQEKQEKQTHVTNPTLTRAQSAPLKRTGNSRKGNANSTDFFKPIEVNGPLGVDRYDGLADRGAEIFKRQMEELAQKIGDPEIDSEMTTEPDEDIDCRRIAPDPRENRRKTQVPKYCSEPPLSSTLNDFESEGNTGEDGAVGYNTEVLDAESEKNKMAAKIKARKSLAKAKTFTKSMTRSSLTSQQKEDQNKIRMKMVDEILSVPFISEEELCEKRALSTGWVSPAITRLCGDEGDKNVLRKSSSEVFHLNMKSPLRPASAACKVTQRASQKKDQSTLPTQPIVIQREDTSMLTTPHKSDQLTKQAKGTIKREASMSTIGSPGGWLGSQNLSDSGALTPDGSGSRGMARALGGALTPDGARTRLSSTQSLTPDGSAARARLSSANRKGVLNRSQRHGSCEPERGEIITLEIKPISMKTTMQRLETMSEAYHKHSFAEYMKEYDIFTGDPIMQWDGGKSTSEMEKLYVRKMNALVGGRALTVNPFSKDQMKRMEQVAKFGKPPPCGSEALRPRSAGSTSDNAVNAKHILAMA